MKIIIKLITMLILIPLIAGYSAAFADTFLLIINSYRKHWHFISGSAAGIILFPFFNRRKFIRTFEHEMTHLLFAKLFFGKIKQLNVTSDGEGYVEYSAFPNPFIVLSPYFFPLFSSCIALLIPILNPAFSLYFYILSGFFLANHLLSSISEIFSSQPDIRQEGIIFSAVFIIFFTIFTYGIIISEVISYGHILTFIKSGFSNSVSYLVYFKSLIISSLSSR
ncbi:MAG: M50 family metallopeptidase [Deltaproteobacteria bacterium]|nr:M50 family metallopeptidase [Deltaproteobacteria bacterium]